MKNKLLILIFLLVSIIGISQTLRNDRYELYLIKFEENEVNIAKGMYMTDKPQSYYEGVIEATSMKTGETKNYTFFFSAWDDKFKEFLIKDKDFNIIKPEIYFNDKEIALVKIGDEEKATKLEDISNLENSILSSMVVWLDNQ